MARWILLGMTILGFVVVFTTHSAALLGPALVVAIIGFIGFVFSLAADRVASSARPEVSMASREDMMAMRKPPARPKPAAPQTTQQIPPNDPRRTG
jgi:hypothetical protein